MINYYDFLNVSPLDDTSKIIKAYKNKMSKYYNKDLSEDEINKIKLLKKAYYVLTNINLRNKYNFLLYKHNNPKEHKPRQVDTVIPENEQDDNNDFNSVFNVDNKWMESNEFLNNKPDDNKIDNSLINGRIFDLSKIYNREIKYEDIPVIKTTRDDKLK